MIFKKILQEKVQLHAIIDREWQQGRSFIEMTTAAIAGGAGVIQYRDKVSCGREFYNNALQVKDVCATHATPFIVNDRLDIALAVGADGVHLGQEDMPLNAARKLAGEDFIIGISASSIEIGLLAADAGADYLGVGAIFPTKTKSDVSVSGLEIIRELLAQVVCPVVAIGGITLENVKEVVKEGVHGIAVISALLKGDIEKNAFLFCENF
jgi:thiamine-phosphate pyrophosphorylase